MQEAWDDLNIVWEIANGWLPDIEFGECEEDE